jgi:hypothetical protein
MQNVKHRALASILGKLIDHDKGRHPEVADKSPRSRSDEWMHLWVELDQTRYIPNPAPDRNRVYL